ncbi:MAG TPA: pilin [Candidatus Paceibacterota bacterium]
MKKIIFIILMLFSLIPAFSIAQEYKLLEPLPCIEGTGNNCKSGEVIKKINLDTYIGYVFKFSIALAAFLAIIMIIWGGVEYMGSEVPFIKSNGKQKIWNAITGLLMVLASYLILATIDPRLVEINTKIEPIEIRQEDLNAVKSFQQSLNEDLKTLSAENQLKFKEIESNKTKLEAERKDLDARYERGEISQEEYDATFLAIEQDIAGLGNTKTKLIAEDNGIASFNRAYETIHNFKASGADNKDLDAYLAEPVTNFLTDGKLPTNSPNIIQNQYNLKINQIRQTDQEGAQKLEYQRDFYIAQVKEEYSLTQKIENMTRYDDSGVRYVVLDKDYLNTELKKYQSNIGDPDKPRQYGIQPEVYNKIMQTRIDTINKTLEKK